MHSTLDATSLTCLVHDVAPRPQRRLGQQGTCRQGSHSCQMLDVCSASSMQKSVQAAHSFLDDYHQHCLQHNMYSAKAWASLPDSALHAKCTQRSGRAECAHKLFSSQVQFATAREACTYDSCGNSAVWPLHAHASPVVIPYDHCSFAVERMIGCQQGNTSMPSCQAVVPSRCQRTHALRHKPASFAQDSQAQGWNPFCNSHVPATNLRLAYS